MPSVIEPPAAPMEQLFEKRRVLVTGPLEEGEASRLCAQLMALDGSSDKPIELTVRSDGGPIVDILAVLDVVGLMRAPVNTLCLGSAKGTAAVLVAAGSGERRAAPSATLTLRCAHRLSADGSAEEIGRLAEELQKAKAAIAAVLAARTNLDPEALEAELERGSIHSAEEAVAMGLIDGVQMAPEGRPDD